MSVYSYAWTTAFSTPATLAGLSATADTEASALDLAVGASADPYHYEYLWEGQIDDADWIEIGRSVDESFVYYLAPLNADVRIRVSDSNGSLYSDPLEGSGELDSFVWAMTHRDGDGRFIFPVLLVEEGATVSLPIDQVTLQPLSSADGDTQLPLVFTGQWQGERVTLTIHVPADDPAVLNAIRAAVLEPSGTIALKDPDGSVYLVQFGGLSLTKQDGYTLVSLTAIRVV